MEELRCEVCHKETAFGVACVPCVPYSAAYGGNCLKENAHPYHILRAEVIICGGVEETGDHFLALRTFVDDKYMTLREALVLHPITQEEIKGGE